MSRLVALEWDGREARVAVGRRRGKDLLLEQAFAVDLGPREAGQAAADPQIGARLAAALAERRIGKGEALVAVGRTGIELRLLSVPPAPDNELPDLVRFQAVRQFSALGDNWPLDFVKLSAGEDGGASVLAAAISPDLVEQIKTTCEAGEITPTNLVLRPFAAASLVARRRPDVRCRLIVDLLTDEADLTVLDGSQVVFIRTVRLPVAGEGDGLDRLLLGEIRRTMVAAQNQLRGKAVECIVLCDDGGDQAALKARAEQELSLAVELFDPFAAVELTYELKKDRPQHSGRFAPLLGILADEAAGTGHAIDFLHPRQRPAPANMRRRNILIGAVAATFVLAVGAAIWLLLSSLDSQISELENAKKKQKPQVDEVQQKEEDLAALDGWSKTEMPWLDELARLSTQMPPAEEAVVSNLVASGRQGQGGRAIAGGEILLDGNLRDSTGAAGLEYKLRDARHEVSGGRTSQDKEGNYPWSFKEKIVIKTDDELKQPAARPGVKTAGRSAAKKGAAP